MANTVATIKNIATCIDGLKDSTKINENPNDNPLIDAYNQGVEAMYASVMTCISAMIGGAREIEMENGGEK